MVKSESIIDPSAQNRARQLDADQHVPIVLAVLRVDPDLERYVA
jgi:hypothetical protein